MAPKHRERKLPVQQLSILAICRFAEPISTTSLYPYLPEMVKSFGVPEREIGKWAGVCAATFSLCQALMGIPWGRFSDKYGRKPAILIGLLCTMITTLMWGFSTTLGMAIAARALAGAGNGNVGIIRTTVAEMVPFKELQPRAFSLMPLVWNIGSIFGPTIGGSLANPLQIAPGTRIVDGSLLERFPYALPNIVSALLFSVGIIIGCLYLEETLETADDRRDYGLMLGRALTNSVKSTISALLKTLRPSSRSQHADTVGERNPLLKSRGTLGDEEDGEIHSSASKAEPLKWREVLNKQAVINLIAYTLLAMHAMAFDQLIPVFAEYSPMGSGDTTPYEPPLKFAGGFGLTNFQMGLMSTCYGVAGMLVQFFLFPPLCRRYGVLFWLKVVACAFPVIYFVTPFTALLPTKQSQIGCIFTVMCLKVLCGIFAFPCTTILLTNSASSMRTLGTLNGIATSISAVGRAAGPAMGGAIFTLGMRRGYVIAPWWFLTAIALLAAVPVFFIVEGEGFGHDDDASEDEEEGDAEAAGEISDALRATALEGEAEAMGKAGPLPSSLPAEQDDEAHHEERVYGNPGPLSRTATGASSSLLMDDEAVQPGGSRASTSGVTSQDPAIPPSLSRRSSRRASRPISIPIGMGNRGISPRYSTNLGQSFGSAGSAGGYH